MLILRLKGLRKLDGKRNGQITIYTLAKSIFYNLKKGKNRAIFPISRKTVDNQCVIYLCLTSDNFPPCGRNSHVTARNTAGGPHDLSCEKTTQHVRTKYFTENQLQSRVIWL